MKGINATALFCEDIRREAASRDTLIGIMPATIYLPSFPGDLRRLSVYVQIRLAVSGKFDKAISVDLDVPGDKGAINNQNREPLPRDMLERSLRRAKERNLPFATITARMLISEPVPVPTPRTVLAILKYGKQKEVCGLLNIMERPKDASTVSPPPSEHSPPVAPPS
jgi:hypothetical protein